MAITPVSIKVAGSAFSSFVSSVNPPYSAEATYLGLYGTDDAQALKNQVTGTAGTKVGTITHGAGFSTFARDAGVDTGVSFSSPFTYYAVCTRPASFQGIMGCWNMADTNYRQSVLADMYPSTQGIGLFVNYVTGQRYAPSSPGPGNSGYNFIFAQYDGATMVAGYGYTDGSGILQLGVGSGAYAYAPTSKALRVGATGYGSAVNNVNYAAAAAFPSVLTLEKLQAEYAFHKARMAILGLTLN